MSLFNQLDKFEGSLGLKQHTSVDPRWFEDGPRTIINGQVIKMGGTCNPKGSPTAQSGSLRPACRPTAESQRSVPNTEGARLHAAADSTPRSVHGGNDGVWFGKAARLNAEVNQRFIKVEAPAGLKTASKNKFARRGNFPFPR